MPQPPEPTPDSQASSPQALSKSQASLRVLFLNPPSLTGELWMKEVGRCGRKAIGGELFPQTGLAYLAAMVEREGQTARIIDAMAEPISLDDLVAECRRWAPHIIIANSATPTIKNDSSVLERLAKATNALCGFSGPHVSVLPEETLRNSTADFGLVNEAEETVAELTRIAVANLGDPATTRAALSGIVGLVWRSSDGIHINPSRPMIENLDTLPFPARHLLPNNKYRMPFFQDHPFATIIPTRGCPWPCTFCRAGRVWGRKIRTRSVSNILEEIEILRRDFGIRHIAFMTDSLTLNRKWAMEFFEGLIARKDPIDWICNSRVDAIDADLLVLMKRGNCRQVLYGLESGSQAILDASRKGITLEQSERAIRLTREAGLQSMAYFILGLPGETADTIRETVRFAKRIAPDYVNFHIATPFPGTDLYDQAVANNWLTSTNWDDFEEEGSSVMQAGELTPAELTAAQRQAMRAFYLRPTRLFRELVRLRSWAEFKAKAMAALKIFSILRQGR